MVEQKFIDRIEDLRHCTYSRITEVQKDLCPMVRKLYLNHQYEYWYEGYKYNVWEEDKHVYAANELPYCYDNELKNTTFIDTLDNLVNEDKVWPFLIFIDGCAIPWSKITIIHDYDYSYLSVKDWPTESFYADIIVFPLMSKKIRYGENNDVLVTHDRKGFYFDKSGHRVESTDFVDLSLRLEILDENIYYKEISIKDYEKDGIKTLQFEDLPDGYIPTLNNIILFNYDGTLNKNIEYNFEDLYYGTYGLFHYIGKNSPVYWAILMYNTSHSKESSYLYDKEDLSKKTILKLLKDNSEKPDEELWNKVINPLISVFDFDHNRDMDYGKNISNAIRYITRYDYRLWRDEFIKDINIKSFAYTGKEFKNLSDNKGYVKFSRKHSDLISDVAMMFVNNKLYNYSLDIIYTTNTINLPIFGIHDTDYVEIIVFTDSNNNILNIKVPDNTTPIYIHPEYDLDNCYIMSEECPDAEYEVDDDPEGRKQYIVDLNYEKVDNNSNYKISFDNDYYYGKDLKIVPRKQFRSYRFKQRGGSYKITLPTQFNYCHDPDRYLIFINGRKIDKTEYTITFTNKNRPFSRLILYIPTILDDGDYIDIYYIPEILVEKYKQDIIPTNGLLLLDDSDNRINYPTTYPLSKYTSMVFINGLKVNPLNIKDIDLNCMLINMDKYERDEDGNIIYDGELNPITNNHYVSSINNITIMEYVPGDKTISGYLEGLYEQIPEGDEYNPELIDFNKSASDNWKKLIKTLIEKYDGINGLKKIFGEVYELENPDSDYKENFANLRSVLYDIVLDWYLDRDDTTTGEAFVYEFERDNFDNESETSETKLINFVPDKDKLLDYEISDLVADSDDVLSEKKFESAE